MRCRILNLWYNNTPTETILKFRLKPERGDNYVLTVYGTESDFYVPAGTLIPDDPRILRVEPGPPSVFGEPTNRVVTRYPSDIRGLRTNYCTSMVSTNKPVWKKTWQADVVSTLKSMIQYGIYDGVDVPDGLLSCHVDDISPCECLVPVTPTYFDIEVTVGAGHFPDPHRKTNAVISISVLHGDQGIVFFLENGTPPRPRTDEYVILPFKSEKELLTAFMTWIQEVRPDFLACWLSRFDVNYLNTRMRVMYPDLAREFCSLITERNMSSQLFDVQVFDVYRAYAMIGDAPSNRLKAVVKHENLVSDVVADTYEARWWGTDNDLLCYYNFMDSKYVRLIDEKKRCFQFFFGLKSTAGLPHIEDTLFNSRVIDTLLMRLSEGRYVFPTKVDQAWDDELQGRNYKGATVFQPSPGYYQTGVAVMDFSRAYPTFIIRYNLSPEVWAGKTTQEGCIPRLCRILMDERERHEAVMNDAFSTYGPESEEYKTAKLKRDVVKYLLNAVYGVIGSSVFRLYDPDVASTVTRIGRDALTRLKYEAERLGYRVIYGDTDSVFVECPDVNTGIRLARELEDRINAWFITYTPESHTHISGVVSDIRLRLKMEKWCRPVIFTEKNNSDEGAKKCYAMRVLWQDGKDVDYTVVKGWAYVRRDTSAVCRHLEKAVIDLALAGRTDKKDTDSLGVTADNIMDLVINVRERYMANKYHIHDIAIPVVASKRLYEYDPVPAFVRGIKYYNEHVAPVLGRPAIQQGETVYFVYVRRVEGLPPTDVISAPDLTEIPLVVNLGKMFEREVRGKIEKKLKVLGVQWYRVMGQTTMEDFL